MRKRLVSFITVMTAALCTLAALELEDVNYSFNALYNGTFSAVAANASVQRTELPGVSIEEVSSDSLTYRLSFNRSDLSQFLPRLRNEGDGSWYSKLLMSAKNTLSPLSGVAAAQLENAGYGEGDVILDGTMVMAFGSKSALSSWIDLMILQDWSSVSFTLKVSMLVTGNGVSEPMAFEGELEGKGLSGERCVELSVTDMLCNGVRITMNPIRFGLK
ncbi:MAG: hypothetical protein ACI4NM_12490 [Bullifex sp.]